MSWSWSRIWDCETATANNPAYSRDDWVRDNGTPHGGAFINALEHVGLYQDTGSVWVPAFR